ncbi:MAG TPA: hypothetical protein VGJ86_03785 [Acidimicrobiales bacterium]
MIDLLTNLINRAETVVVAFVALMAMAMVVVTWARTRAFVATLGAVLFAVFVTWAVRNVDLLEEQVNEDIVTESGG